MERGDSLTTGIFRKVSVGVVCLALIPPVHAATCPFDGGGSDAVNDGIVLTRYALGITGAPLVASTRYASLDPLQVKNNIECVGCALDMNGDSAIDTVDTTIIARHLAGFSGSALTSGLALGSGTRSTPASVQSFLASGCAVGGVIDAFVQGGNSFGADGQLGLNDAFALNLRVSGYGGLRIEPTATSSVTNTVGGSFANQVSSSVYGATIGGGGAALNTISVSDGPNTVGGVFGTVGGGFSNQAGSIALGGSYQTVSGGSRNLAAGSASTVVGGESNTASGPGSTVLGGLLNRAGSELSAAAGFRAVVRSPVEAGTPTGDAGTFVWADTSESSSFVSTGANQFNIRAAGGVRLHNNTRQFFGTQGRQMLNLWAEEFGIGVQANTLYFRSFDKFSWHRQGVHNDAEGNPGGGAQIMQLTNTNLTIAGTLVQGSDRGIKENFASVNPKSILAKVASLPISLWNYKADNDKTQHVGPMAQDFKRLFGVGQDDKTIATVDASGIALAAIQGLHALVKEKDAEIARLKEKAKRVDSLERDLAAVMKRLGMK